MSNPNGGGLAHLPASSPGAVPPGSGLDMPPEDEEIWSSRALLLVLLLLILSFWVSYYLKIRRIRSIHETIVAMFAGMCVGLLVRLAPGEIIQSMITFKSTILLNVLLPPIILNSGYQLKQENFFRNFGVIITFAFAGTFISAVVLGVIVYVYSLLGLEGLSLTIIECLLFGSTLSATDPVTILAIFNALHVDPKLYSVIFGESILNDAVAIVMFETLSQFHGEKIHVLSFFHGVGIFLLTFCVSMLLGVIFGLSCSLMLKHSELGRYTEIESCLVFLIAYTSYFFSNAVTMSGIVSLLFCGITLKHYAYHNMSHRTQRTSRYMFGSLAQLSENFIFIYLGLSLFTQTQLVYKPMFILVTAFAVCIARYCAVFPISKAINVFFQARGNRADELPHSYQMMLFWAGLRGAVGVALAEGMKGSNAIALRTTVLVSVVMTVVVFGGTIGRMIEILGIKTGVEDDDPESSDDENAGGYAVTGNGNEDDVEGNGSARSRNGQSHKLRRSLPISGKFGGNGQQAQQNRTGSIAGGRGGGGGGDDFDDAATIVPTMDSPYNDRMAMRAMAATTGGNNGSGTRLGHLHPHGSFRSSSSAHSTPTTDSEDSDSEVLPSVSKVGAPAPGDGDLTRVWRDGQWFTVLDERYLLPVFSNATASRRQATKKAILREKRKSIAPDGTEEYDDQTGDSHPGSPYLNPRISSVANQGPRSSPADFNGSFTDILSSLVSSGPVDSKRRASYAEGETRDITTIDLGSPSNRQLSSTAQTPRPRPTGHSSGDRIYAQSAPAAGERHGGNVTPIARPSTSPTNTSSGPMTPVMPFTPGTTSSARKGSQAGGGSR